MHACWFHNAFDDVAGVETRTQADFFSANGCQTMQGYLFARPQPLAQVLADLQEAIATHQA